MSIGRWVYMPPNPPRPPPIRFLFVEHAFCYQLPSDSTSPLNPCRVANLSPHRAGSGFAPYRETPCWAHMKKRTGTDPILNPFFLRSLLADYLFFFKDAVIASAASTPEIIAQEFIMAVMESAPLAPPTTQPAP